MLTIVQFEEMLKLQSEINATVNPDWLKAGYPYLRAALMEGAEAIEHIGWKWWKHQEKNLPALQMEAVDIWHFYLSAKLIASQGNIPIAAKELKTQSESKSQSVDFDHKTYTISQLNLVEKFELLIGLAASRRMSIPLFSALLNETTLSWEELYRQYTGKNTLNLFRQAHGYKEGHYQKMWGGREDNEYLVEILREIDFKEGQFKERIFAHLSEKYSQSVKK